MTGRIPPTPDNYRVVYHEVSGQGVPDGPFPEKQLRNLMAALPKDAPDQMRLARELDSAIKAADWDTYKNHLAEFITGLVSVQQLPWSDLISELLRQWEVRHQGVTTARKRETLEHAFKSGGSPDMMFHRVQQVVRNWSAEGVENAEVPLADPPAPATPSTVSAPALPASAQDDTRTLFAYSLETLIAPLLDGNPTISTEAVHLATDIRQAKTAADWKSLNDKLRKFAFRLELLSEDNAALREGLMSLLRLIVDNVDQLVIDDQWLHGQVEMVREIIDKPLSQRGLEDAERRMKDVIFKQSQLKQRLAEAQQALKSMLAGFVDQLADFSDATSDYHDKIEQYANQISQSQDISQLQELIHDVMRETRVIQVNAQRSRDDLRSTQARVAEAEGRIRELEQELSETSSLVRYDQLTGVLNRRGLEEMFTKEFKRATRRQTPLCVALLDIDNFKKLNDSLGHDAGDGALVHLATVIRETMRPEDSVARFGGEEFIILLPDTPVEDAQHGLVRLQRELTRRIYLHEHHKTLITFSAGVTQVQSNDTQATVIKRADTAMYQAKQSGKNRVCLG